MTTPHDPRPELSNSVQTWPYLVRIEALAAIAALIVLLAWSIGVDAPLEVAANPGLTPNPSKAPWYFVGLQELLVYFDPWIAGVAIPATILFGLAAIPYLDVNPKGNGYYTLRDRPLAVAIFLFGFFALWLVPIGVGVFLRGPGWHLFLPWERWESRNVAELANVNLWSAVERHSPTWGAILGGASLASYFLLPSLGVRAWLRRRHADALAALGGWRYAIVSVLFLAMMLVPIKMLLRWIFHIKYVWVFPGVLSV